MRNIIYLLNLIINFIKFYIYIYKILEIFLTCSTFSTSHNQGQNEPLEKFTCTTEEKTTPAPFFSCLFVFVAIIRS